MASSLSKALTLDRAEAPEILALSTYWQGTVTASTICRHIERTSCNRCCHDSVAGMEVVLTSALNRKTSCRLSMLSQMTSRWVPEGKWYWNFCVQLLALQSLSSALNVWAGSALHQRDTITSFNPHRFDCWIYW